jgi:hypothetical protein
VQKSNLTNIIVKLFTLDAVADKLECLSLASHFLPSLTSVENQGPYFMSVFY